jgi:hypothetical protein
MQPRLALLALILLLAGCSDKLVAVRIVRVEPSTPGFNGHSSYTVVEDLATKERRWIRGTPGAPGEVISVPASSTLSF